MNLERLYSENLPTAKWSYKEAPASKNLEFIKQCVLQLPLGTKFDRFRADSAYGKKLMK
jgi:hypothetical protein